MMMCPERTLTPTQVCDIYSLFQYLCIQHFPKPVHAAHFHFCSFYFVCVCFFVFLNLDYSFRLFLENIMLILSVLICNPRE